MKSSLIYKILIIIVIQSAIINAQPSWVSTAFNKAGMVNPNKKASAIILTDIANVIIFDDKEAKITIRLAYKILSKEGEDFGRLSIPINENLKVDDIAGWLKKPKQKIIELDDENTYTIGDMNNSYEHNESGTFFAMLPNVKSGDLVAFEVELEEEDWTSLFQSFVFQRQQPVLYTKYNITIPDGWKIQTASFNIDSIKYSQNGQKFSWTGRNLPYKEVEPIAPSLNYLSSKILVSVFNPEERSPTQFREWEMVASWLANVYEDLSQPNDLIAKKARK